MLPGFAPVSRGPYRWLKHPNYLIVALEIAVVPLALGLPLFALIFSPANAALLAYRSASKTRRWLRRSYSKGAKPKDLLVEQRPSSN